MHPEEYPAELFIKIYFGKATLEDYYDIYERSYEDYEKAMSEWSGLITEFPVWHRSKEELNDKYTFWKFWQTRCNKLPPKRKLKNMTPEEIEQLANKILENLDENDWLL